MRRQILLKRLKLILFQLLLAINSFAHKQLWDANQTAWTQLMIYTYNNRYDEIDSLIRVGKNIDEQNTEGYTALWVAILKGNKKTVKFLLDNGANPNLEDTSGISPLMNACLMNSYRISKMLLLNKAIVNYDKNGYTALMSATSFGSPRLLKLLIDNGASVNIRRKVDDYTALHLARYCFYLGHTYKRKYKILKRHAAIE